MMFIAFCRTCFGIPSGPGALSPGQVWGVAAGVLHGACVLASVEVGEVCVWGFKVREERTL
jgi:hypothetical protein